MSLTSKGCEPEPRWLSGYKSQPFENGDENGSGDTGNSNRRCYPVLPIQLLACHRLLAFFTDFLRIIIIRYSDTEVKIIRPDAAATLTGARCQRAPNASAVANRAYGWVVNRAYRWEELEGCLSYLVLSFFDELYQ